MEYVSLARVAVSFLGVIALILLCAWIAKRLDVQKRLANMRKDARLALVESVHIDGRHKLVIVRREAKHHLLLLGQQAPLHIESYDAPAAEETEDA